MNFTVSTMKKGHGTLQRLLGMMLSIGSITSVMAQSSLQPIGVWREHLPYGSAINLAGSASKIYCATPYSLFTVDPTDLSIERMSRITGLSETGISTIAYDDANETLVVAYDNSNIDLLTGTDIINIPDIRQDNFTGNKKIYSIYPQGNLYYLATGFGIVVLDAVRREVKDSWFIGANGNPVQVNAVAMDATYYYAATQEGLKKAALSITDPADFSRWILVTDGLSSGPVQNVMKLGDRMIAQKNDSIFIQDGNNWSLLFANDYSITDLSVSAGRIFVAQRKSSGEAQVLQLNSSGVIERTLREPNVISLPRKTLSVGAATWLADEYGGLSRFDATGFVQLKPNSPEATASGEMTVYNNKFYATAGEVNEAWNYLYNGNGIYILQQGEWRNINRYRYHAIDSLLDYMTVVIDPLDESIWAGSYGGGLLHVKEGPSFEIFKQGYIGAAIGDPTSYRVSGLAMDAQHNLWISNFGAEQPLAVRKQDGSWQRFSIPFFLPENSLAQILIDDNNYKWIVGAKGRGLICYDHGESIESTSDDRWKSYSVTVGGGNLPDGDVLCVAKDKSGFIWVGTANGIGVIQCAQQVFDAGGCETVWPIVQEGNFASYLFNGQQVRSIAVDGADRKWVATATGVSLISADGRTLVEHFTEDNSPLLSNDVKKIAIDNNSGEVYFATLKGICSFRGTATAATENKNAVQVFPNPVPPSFSGTIAIRGLAENAIVKITEPGGRLVYQTRALGGQAVWDGRDYRGNKIATGVYLVLVSTDPSSGSPKQSAAAKIVFIGK